MADRAAASKRRAESPADKDVESKKKARVGDEHDLFEVCGS